MNGSLTMMRGRGRAGPMGGGDMGRGAGVSAGRGAGMGAGRGAGRGRTPSAAQLLLQKANTQLRGERVPIKPKEEDELASYLNSLTQKTTQQSKSVNYEEYGDISISSGQDHSMTPRLRKTPSPTVGAGSKFLKKKAPAAEETTPAKKPASNASGGAYGIKQTGAKSNLRVSDDDDDDDEVYRPGASNYKAGGTSPAAASKAPKFGTSMSAPGSAKRGGTQMSSALSRASALTEKITRRSGTSAPTGGRKHRSRRDSDTDESLSMGPGKKRHSGRGSRPGSAASDNSIGHDGKKFLKKKGGPADAPEVSKPDAGRKSPARPSSRERAKSRSPGEPKVRKSSSLMRLSSNVYLTSEEESMAEFIAGLSGSDESKTLNKAKQTTTAKTKRQVSKSPSPSPSPQRRTRHQSPSPSPSAKGRNRSGSKDKPKRPVFRRMSSSESVMSDVGDSKHEKIMIADSISLEEPFQIKLMDADTLGPVLMMTPEPASYSETNKKSKKKSTSPFKKARSPSPSLKKKPKDDKKKKSEIFQSFGVQSIEDLMSDKENTDSEIPTEPIGKKKRRPSSSQIVTDIGGSRATPQRQVSYTDDFETSISERIGDKGKGPWAKKRAESPIGTQYSEEETGVDYTEDFASETLSVAKEESDRSSHYRYSDEDFDDDRTDTSETLSDESARPHRPTIAGEHKVVVEKKSVEIQTALPAGLSYQWMSQTGVSVLGPSRGLGNVDPTPIATTVISADALETMTAYSPASLVIHDMLKQQIELIKQFAQAHDRLYHSLTDSNVPNYKYTTLEGTKAFIKKHKKPRLTMKQALKMVDEEMNRH